MILRFPRVTGALKVTKSFPVTTLALDPKNSVVGLLFDNAVDMAESTYALFVASVEATPVANVYIF